MKWIALVLIGLGLTVGAPQASAQTTPAPVTPSERILGRPDAPVTVIEYASFVCSHCAHWHMTVLPAFKARWIDTGQVRLVFRDLPTAPVEVGARAAGIGLCAAPDRFFDVARSLMTGQASLSSGGTVADWYAAAIAVSGRSEAEIDACLADPATLQTLRAEMRGAREAGVRGTPTFFVNGRFVPDSSLEGLSAAIQPLLSQP